MDSPAISKEGGRDALQLSKWQSQLAVTPSKSELKRLIPTPPGVVQRVRHQRETVILRHNLNDRDRREKIGPQKPQPSNRVVHFSIIVELNMHTPG
jgi:hypothetical protein